MGKYLKKSKPKAADVSHQPSSSSSHLLTAGVRTRAKTLALQRLCQSQPPPPPRPLEESESELCYLQLRSRRLHKTNVSSKGKERERKALAKEEEEGGGYERGVGPSVSVVASFGENDPEFDARDRSTRESTPCSFIGGSNTIPMPGSTNRRRSSISSHRRVIPTTQEIEDFFATAEELQRKSFIEKYNFDILNDAPLPGRYEWVEVMP